MQHDPVGIIIRDLQLIDRKAKRVDRRRGRDDDRRNKRGRGGLQTVRLMSSWKHLIVALNDARRKQIGLLKDRVAIYADDPVRFAERIAELKELLSRLEATPPRRFEDSLYD